MSNTRSGIAPPTEAEQVLLQEADFAWDLAIQLTDLREHRGLSQAALAQRLNTQQQAISRLENPGYDRQSLSTLRRVARALSAHVEVVLIPDEQVPTYLACRYRPLLDAVPPSFTLFAQDTLRLGELLPDFWDAPRTHTPVSVTALVQVLVDETDWHKILASPNLETQRPRRAEITPQPNPVQSAFKQARELDLGTIMAPRRSSQVGTMPKREVHKPPVGSLSA